MKIRPYTSSDEAAVIDLWHRCDLVRPWNDPRRDILRKTACQPDLFLVGTIHDTVVATVMGGYEGHRGWVNYLAVATEHRRNGLGRQMMSAAETRLRGLGCPKVNVQIRASNHAVVEFYRRLGYGTDDVVSFGKRLTRDDLRDEP